MALGYLISTVIQVEDTDGKPLTGGWINVFEHGTTTPAVTYKDFDGDLNQNNVYLDHKGMCTILADADGMYDVYCYDIDGVEQWSRLNIGVVGGAGGASIDITSSDHSLVVSKVITGGRTNFDLTQNLDSKDLLEWIRCDGSSQVVGTDIHKPFYTKGTMRMGDRGIQLYRDRYYHVTAHVTANKSLNAEPYYDDVDIKFVLDYGGGAQSTIVTNTCTVDYSLLRAQEYEVSADVFPTSNAELLVEIADVETDNTFNIADIEVHRVYSGAPYIPGEWLTQIQSDWTEDDISKTSYIQHKPDLSVYATNAALTAGLATKQDVISDLQTIREGAALGATAVQDANYVHTDNNFTDAEKNKLSGIAAGAEVNVQSDWNTTDTSADSFIKNKPANLVQDANYVHTDNNFTTTLKDKLDGIASGAEVNVQSNWTETDTSSDAYIQNKPSLATVATTGSYSDLSNKPNLATVATTGSYNDLTNKPTIPAAQVNSDWDATSGVAAILNKPTIPAAQVNSDWNATTGVAAILNKPSVPNIKTTSTTLPPVDTNVSNMTLFTDGRVTVNNSTDVGLLAPIGTQSDAGKVLTGTYSGSPGKFTAAWTPVQSPLSAGNGITISSNVVSAKVKSNGGLVLDSNGLAVDSSFSGMFIGTYSQSTKTPYNDYKTAYDAGKAVYLRMTALGGDAMFQLYDIDSNKVVFTRIVGIASVYYTDSVVSTIIVSSSNVYNTYNTTLAAKADLDGKNPTLSTSGSISTYWNNTKLRLRKFNASTTGSWVGPGVSGSTTCNVVTRIYTNFDSSHLYAFPCPQNTSSYNTFSPVFRKIMYDGVLKFTNNTGTTDYVASIEPGNFTSASSITTWCDEAVCRVMVETGTHFVKIRGSAFYEVGVEYTNEPTSNSNRCLRVNAMSSSVSYEVMELFTKCVDYYYSAD
jgi:hypothetical protein